MDFGKNIFKVRQIFFSVVTCRVINFMLCCKRGLSLGGSVTLCKGGDAMNYVTYSDLIQFGILIVAIIALCKTGR